MSEELSTRFNMNQLLTFGDKENHLTFGAYNGNPRMSFGPREFIKGKAPRSIILSPPKRYLLLSLMNWVINNAAPGIKKSITIRGIWNAETKKSELSAVITIGMDDKAVCYIGIKHIDDKHESYTHKFELTGERSTEVAGEYDDDATRSMATLRMIASELKNGLISIGGLLTRNHLVQPSNNKKSGYNSSNNHKSSASEDLDF